MANTHQGKLLKGQQYRPTDDFIIPYTELKQNFVGDEGVEQLGNERTEIIPEDAQCSTVRVYDIDRDAILAISKSMVGTTDLRLPDELLSINVTYNIAEGAGEHVENGDGTSAGVSAGMTLHLNSKSQGSASIMPDIQPIIRQRWTVNVPCTYYLFYMEDGYSETDLFNRLSDLAEDTVNPWPQFRPTSLVFTLKGQSASVSADADVQQHVSISNTNVTYTWGEGEGKSWQVSTTVKTVVIPPTLHGTINISGDTPETADLIASAESSWENALNWPARSASSSVSGSIEGSISPSIVSATTPSSIPSSGLYLHRVVAEPYDFGFIRVRAEVVDFSKI